MSNYSKTLNEIYNTLNEEQKDLIYALIGLILKEEKQNANHKTAYDLLPGESFIFGQNLPPII